MACSASNDDRHPNNSSIGGTMTGAHCDCSLFAPQKNFALRLSALSATEIAQYHSFADVHMCTCAPTSSGQTAPYIHAVLMTISFSSSENSAETKKQRSAIFKFS